MPRLPKTTDECALAAPVLVIPIREVALPQDAMLAVNSGRSKIFGPSGEPRLQRRPQHAQGAFSFANRRLNRDQWS